MVVPGGVMVVHCHRIAEPASRFLDEIYRTRLRLTTRLSSTDWLAPLALDVGSGR